MSEPLPANEDFVDIVRCLTAARCEFVVVGAYALAAHGVVRATGDLDVLVRATPENAPRLMHALRAFGAPIEMHGVRESDFHRPGQVYQMGLPPRRIDVLTQISGVTFDDAVAAPVVGHVGGESVPCIGLDALLRNKRASGRPKDLGDVAALEALQPTR